MSAPSAAPKSSSGGGSNAPAGLTTGLCAMFAGLVALIFLG